MTAPASPAGDLADRVSSAVLACPVVVRLAAGRADTFLPGRRVAGVRLDDQVCEVAVVLRLDIGPVAGARSVPELAELVRRAVEPVAAGLAVDVVVTDVLTADEAAEQSPPSAPPSVSTLPGPPPALPPPVVPAPTTAPPPAGP